MGQEEAGLFEEMMALKAGLELDLISLDKVKTCVDEFYQAIKGKKTAGPLKILIQRGDLSESQAEFLREGVEEDKSRGNLPPQFDVKDRRAVEGILGIGLAGIEIPPEDESLGSFNLLDISSVECRALLDLYYNSQGKSSDNFAVLLFSEGYITKFQYDTLLSVLEKNRKARKIPHLNMACRKDVEKYLQSSEEKKLTRITCPHCQTAFQARVSAKGGKFRCGKCLKSFFLQVHTNSKRMR